LVTTLQIKLSRKKKPLCQNLSFWEQEGKKTLLPRSGTPKCSVK